MRRQRFFALLALLLLIGAFRLAQQLYRWQAFKAERTEIVRLEVDLDSSALGIVATEMRAGTLRTAIEAADEGLASARSRLDNVERAAEVRGLDLSQEISYRDDLAAFNAEVRRRNELVREWRQILTSNHEHVDRYNLIADSIRAVALRMGEPYFPISTPAEIAAARGEGVVSDSSR
jgi:hypothetical protein